MKFLLLLYMNPSAMDTLSPQQRREVDQRSARSDDALRARGQLLAAEALQGPERAVCVRRPGGRLSTTDGPFIESKEHVGGFLLIEARDMDEAVRIASQDELLSLGATIEVRPVYDYRAELERQPSSGPST